MFSSKRFMCKHILFHLLCFYVMMIEYELQFHCLNKTCLKQNVMFSLLPLLGKYSYAFGQQLTMPTAPSVLPPSPTSGKSRTAVYRACAKISVKAVYCTFTKAFYRVNGLLLLLLLSPSDMSYSEDLSDDLFTWWMLLFNEL